MVGALLNSKLLSVTRQKLEVYRLGLLTHATHPKSAVTVDILSAGIARLKLNFVVRSVVLSAMLT